MATVSFDESQSVPSVSVPRPPSMSAPAAVRPRLPVTPGTSAVIPAASAVRRRRLSAVAGALTVIVLSLAAVGPAGAQDPLDCSANVVDTSGVVDVEAVLAAVDAVDPAAVVVVRSFDSVPQADLVAAVDEVLATCFDDDVTGEINEDIVVLGVSVDDRLSDVLVGERWRTAVPDADVLRSEVMGPRFANGDFTGGLVAAIDEVAVGVDAALGAPGTPNQPVPSDDADLPEPTGAETDGSDGSDGSVDVEPVGGGQSPWAIGGGVAGIAACGGVFLLVNRYRRLTSARNDFARSSAGPVARLGVLRERDARLTAQADVWSKTTEGRTLVNLQGLLREVDAGRAAADRAAGLLSQSIPDGAENAAMDEIGRAQARVIELSRALDLHDESLDRLAAFGAHVDHLRVALPAKAGLLDHEVDEALEMSEQRESEGWSVEGQRTELERIGDTIDELDFERLELDLLALSDVIEAAEARLFAVGHYLQSLPSRVNSLKKWNAGLEAATDLELRRIDDLRRQFAAAAATHASDSWQWAADYPEQAVEELNAAEQLQDVAISQLISAHHFDEAGRQLDAAGLRLMAADHLLDQVDDLIVDLDQAMAEAPGIVAQCHDVLRDLADFIGRYQKDLDPELVSRPADLARAIEGLQRELRQKKPNYLRVAETGDRFNRQIDQLLVEAKDQQLRTEALRRELRREVARAERAVSRARRSLGWELFESRDGSALDDLEQSLRRLPDDPAAATLAAAEIADDALRIQERIIARRRRSGVWVTTGGGGLSTGGGGWISGGSRSGGGSFGGASAGRSFGGGGSAGGGRSFGGGRSSGSF